jgi:microcystin-dependent protein
MSEPFIGEIKIVSFRFAMKGWAMCDGQLLPINQNQALFSLLGTSYGGDGRTNFALPNLQGASPVCPGSEITVNGQKGGELHHTLSLPELPSHTHVPAGSTGAPAAGGPGGNLWATITGVNPYSGSGNTAMSPAAIGPAGGNNAHVNLQPFLTLTFVIALTGIFPSRN